jgi:hypothetical protein
MARQPRIEAAEGLGKLKASRARKFAEFVRQGDEPGLTPCWGAIAKRFERDFTSVAERAAVWRALVDLGDKNALLLFVKHNLSQADVLQTVGQEAQSLPVVVQRVLVSLDEVRPHLEGKVQELSVEAQQIWAADDDTRRGERERFESRTAKLMAVDYISDQSAETPEPAAETPKPPARRRPRG